MRPIYGYIKLKILLSAHDLMSSVSAGPFSVNLIIFYSVNIIGHGQWILGCELYKI